MEELIREAVALLDKKFILPQQGFLAGGALANTINKIKHGGKCVINDIDLFILEGIDDFKHRVFNEREKSITVLKEELTKKKVCHSEYTYLIRGHKREKFMEIREYGRDGMFNNIKYVSHAEDYMFLLDTFDINCTQVGYDLATGKCYWTNRFEDFINTKELKFGFMSSPSHSILRILKKRDELEATLNLEEEIRYLYASCLNKVVGKKLHWFANQKYLDMYFKYKNELNPFFELKRKTRYVYKRIKTGQSEAVDKIKHNHSDLRNDKDYQYEKEHISYRLYPKKWKYDNKGEADNVYLDTNNEFVRDNRVNDETKLFDPFKNKHIFNKPLTMDDMEFYWRNIRNDTDKKYIWYNLQNFYKQNDYLRDFPMEKFQQYEKSISELADWVEKYSCLFFSLEGMSLMEQLAWKDLYKGLFQFDKKAMIILKIHDLPWIGKNKEEIMYAITFLKIKYRHKIHKELLMHEQRYKGE